MTAALPADEERAKELHLELIRTAGYDHHRAMILAALSAVRAEASAETAGLRAVARAAIRYRTAIAAYEALSAKRGSAVSAERAGQADDAEVAFDDAIAALPKCEAGQPEIGGECACKPPETLADDPPRSVEEVLDASVPGEHVAALHGDPRRTGVVDRWSWSCRCGAGSKRADMTIFDAQADHARHAEAAR